MFFSKAQISQTFVYILVILIIGIAAILGYRGIKVFTSTAAQISLADFETTLRSEVKKTSYGDVRKVELLLPTDTDYLEICFLSLNNLSIHSSNFTDYPLIEDYYDDNKGNLKTENVFLKNGQFRAFAAGPVTTPNNALSCLSLNTGRIALKMEGLGQLVRISTWS